MLVDLHAHYPMHVLPDSAQRRTHDRLRDWNRRRRRALIVNFVSRLFNYQGPGDTPSVTESLLRDGDVGVVLSVLYGAFDEIDLSKSYGAPPAASYFADVVAQLELVEDHVARTGEAVIAHSPAELDGLLTGGRPILIHAIEGGFQLGQDEPAIKANVRTLADRGVAYVTVAHLFWRDVATNAPALPFLPDWLYHLVFPEPDVGLTPLGRAAVEAMAQHGILVDITHMSERSIADTFALLDERDPGKRIPVIATHMACRFGGLEYCFDDDTIRRVAERGGLLACILCEHYISSGLKRRTSSYDDSIELLFTHIDRIRKITGSADHVAIGSDLDGYIKPALPGLEHMGHMRRLQQSLHDRYGPAEAEQMCNGNALRVLRGAWRREFTAP
jgi:microsomal dipeptidase-like Zn-dependent dipeptidase